MNISVNESITWKRGWKWKCENVWEIVNVIRSSKNQVQNVIILGDLVKYGWAANCDVLGR